MIVAIVIVAIVMIAIVMVAIVIVAIVIVPILIVAIVIVAIVIIQLPYVSHSQVEHSIHIIHSTSSRNNSRIQATTVRNVIQLPYFLRTKVDHELVPPLAVSSYPAGRPCRKSVELAPAPVTAESELLLWALQVGPPNANRAAARG